MAELHHTLGPWQVSQRVRTEIGQECALWQPVDDEIACGTGQHRLAAVCEIAQSCRPVDRRADVVALIAQLHLAGVQADAQSDRGERCTLQLQRTCHCVARTGERDDETVALALLDGTGTVVRGGRIGHRRVEACHGGGHLVGLVFPQAGGAFDVGEQQRHCSAGEKLAHAHVAPIRLAHANQPAAMPYRQHPPNGLIGQAPADMRIRLGSSADDPGQHPTG